MWSCVIWLGSLSALLTLTEGSGDPICDGERSVVDTGHGFTKDPTDCSKYYHCDNNIPKGQQCGFDTFWIQHYLTCAHWNAQECPTSANICSGKADLTLIPYLGCDTYWTCMAEVPKATKCQQGFVFDATNLVCISDPTNPCLASNTLQVCNTLPDPKDPTKYFEKVQQQDGSFINIPRDCPPGTQYQQTDCLCGTSNIVAAAATSTACEALLEQGVGRTFTWRGNEDVVIGSENVNFPPGENKMEFMPPPQSSINIWRLAQYDFKASFAVTLTITFPSFTGSSPVEEMILVNCIYDQTRHPSSTDEPSIMLYVIKQQGNFDFKGKIGTYDADRTVNAIIAPTGPIDVTFAYDGTTVLLKLETTTSTSETSTSLTGNIKLAQSGIVLGRGIAPNEKPLTADISNLKIFDCVTQIIITN